MKQLYGVISPVVWEINHRRFQFRRTRLEKGGRKDRKTMSRLMLGCCKVYISESRNKVALQSIERVAKLFFPVAAIVNKFEDETYNRVGYTLVSKLHPKPSSGSCSLKDAVFEMVKAALGAIDFNNHSGSHPRLGVVDHICFHPLGSTNLEQIAGVAKSLASDIGSSLEGSPLNFEWDDIPTFLYGAAHENGRTLDSIRRDLGYFSPNAHGNVWAGGPDSDDLHLKPDEGPAKVHRSKGIMVIGTTRWVDNYNVPVYTSDISAVRRVAKRVSGRGGGLPSVQSMALTHGENAIEVACNLLDPSLIGGDQVQIEVERLGREEGMDVGKGYYTDLSQDEITQAYLKLAS